MKLVQLAKICVLILVLTVIHSILDVRDLLLHRDVLKNLTKSTDLNNNNHNGEEAYASFLFAVYYKIIRTILYFIQKMDKAMVNCQDN